MSAAAAVRLSRPLPKALAAEAAKAHRAYAHACDPRATRKGPARGWSPRPLAAYRVSMAIGDAVSRTLALIESRTAGQMTPGGVDAPRPVWVELTDKEAGNAIGFHPDMFRRAVAELAELGVVVVQNVSGRKFYRLDWEAMEQIGPPKKQDRDRAAALRLVPDIERLEDDPEGADDDENAPESPAKAKAMPSKDPLVVFNGKAVPFSEVCSNAECAARIKGESQKTQPNGINGLQTTPQNIFGGVDAAAAKAWDAVNTFFQRKIGEGEAYISKTRPVSLTDGTLTIAASSEFERQFIEEDYNLVAAAKAADVERIRVEAAPHLFPPPAAPAECTPASCGPGLSPDLVPQLQRNYPNLKEPPPPDLADRLLQVLHTPESLLLDSKRQRRDITSWGFLWKRKAVDAVLANLQQQGHNVGWLR